MNVLYQESGHLGARKRKGLAKTYSFKERSFFERRQQSTLKAKQSTLLLHTRNVYFVLETENGREHSMQFGKAAGCRDK